MITPIGNRRVKARKDAFVDLVLENKSKVWYICSHDNPDPDSLGSCLGVQHILNFLGVEETHVVYCGEIDNPQNLAMQNVLDLRIEKWEEIESDRRSGDNAMFIFVDCSVGQKNMSIGATPNVVIDHHKIPITNKDILFIHDEVGACATLVLDLALSISVELEDEETQGCFNTEEEGIKELATALAIGIKTDTLDFLAETTTADDFQAYRIVGKLISDEKFHKIVNYELPPYVLDYEQIAWKNKNSEYVPHFITGLGYIKEGQSGCIPTIADKFRRIPGVQTVVVYGIIGSSVRASVRTSSTAFDCESLCTALFGRGNGGSKRGIGGAKVKFNIFVPEKMSDENRESLWMLLKGQIEQQFAEFTSK